MATLPAQARSGFRPMLQRPALVASIVLAAAAIAVLLWLVWPRSTATPQPTAGEAVSAITLSDLIPDLVRVGAGPGGSELETTFAPRPTLGLFSYHAPDAARADGVVSFLVREDLHERDLPADRPVISLAFDNGRPVAPLAVVSAFDDPRHRATWYVFSTVTQSGRDLLAESSAMSLTVPGADSSAPSFLKWDLPIILPESLGTSSAVGISLATLTRALTRDLGEVAYAGYTGRQQLTFATDAYVAKALGAAAVERLQPADFIVVMATETLHTADLPTLGAPPALSVNGATRPYVDQFIITESPHHRVTAYRFKKPAGFDGGHQVMEARTSAGGEAVWHLPIAENTATTALATGGASWALILALLGGMVAAMWPCLFQLTAFFIPAMAGVTMQQSAEPASAGRRFLVIKAAMFFVAGFTLVYTLAGALIGLAAQRLGDTASFEVWQRWIGVGGGVIIIALALRSAAKVRAPLVCKMPVLGKMAHQNKAAKPAEMMLAGIAYATGCMTCFGSALVVGMVVYVGMAQSPLYGAGVLFLFALGMGIPLVAGAAAMAKVLPLLVKMDKVVPWMGLASAVIMIGFGVLLISGNYMVLTNWAYRLVGVAG
ncbi:MAG: sulfite exporter TauE/SafE family protein [Chloroflexi bacterium]|nr:sulfite exporter TauE/SafE family protein [Chloroflexota bacterium]